MTPLTRVPRASRVVLGRARRSVQAAAWAMREHRRVRGLLPDRGLRAAVRPPARELPWHVSRAVVWALRLRRATCLERSLVLQCWYAAHGDPRDVVIGIKRGDEVEAHAWLEGIEGDEGHTELYRLPALRS